MMNRPRSNKFGRTNRRPLFHSTPGGDSQAPSRSTLLRIAAKHILKLRRGYPARMSRSKTTYQEGQDRGKCEAGNQAKTEIQRQVRAYRTKARFGAISHFNSCVRLGHFSLSAIDVDDPVGNLGRGDAIFAVHSRGWCCEIGEPHHASELRGLARRGVARLFPAISSIQARITRFRTWM